MPEVSISKLSPTQMRKMKQGKPIRISSGSAMNVFLNDLQYKGFVKNGKLGKKYTAIIESKTGSGILGAILSGAAGLSDLIGGPGSREASQVLSTIGGVSNAVGLGMRKKGKGLMGDIAKELAINMAKSAGKFAINKGADYAKGKIEGLGMLRKASPQQCEALARARAMRKMKKSSKGKKGKRGGALYQAGY
jgi:hypothetical protein